MQFNKILAGAVVGVVIAGSALTACNSDTTVSTITSPVKVATPKVINTPPTRLCALTRNKNCP